MIGSMCVLSDVLKSCCYGDVVFSEWMGKKDVHIFAVNSRVPFWDVLTSVLAADFLVCDRDDFVSSRDGVLESTVDHILRSKESESDGSIFKGAGSSQESV
ncbi:hypothetical protein CEXT_490821 [Caerostris extrusa]|uniref:Uncharacterized protein n=1 Tax=Caerostris extrusa TaxID=172846 RepID=A0AAV4XKR7_CAEEX|nr:hypothetical protein CEXT_490821 [Caerostris extrusa]